MTYEESVRYLYSLGRELASPRQASATKFNLDGITTLCERLGQPQRAWESVHIAGTNGKGSTAAMIDSILRAAGLRTGLYTSPHLERINERIRLDGCEISDADFAATFTRVSTVAFDLERMGLDPIRELTATISGDGRTDLRLLGKWGSSGVEVTLGASSEVVSPDGDALTLSRGFRDEQRDCGFG